MSGLDMMKAQRDKRRVGNEMPKPMHPARATPVNLPAAEPDRAEAVTQTPDAAEVVGLVEQPGDGTGQDDVGDQGRADESRVTSTTAAQKATGARQVAKSDTPTALYPTTAYLELEEDQYIRRIIDAGRYGKPKVTSASAIIRYAVQHLAKTMTPEQVVVAIREAAPATSNQGRIRL